MNWTEAIGSEREVPQPASGPGVPRAAGDNRVERALAYVAKMDPAISGQGGHGATWAAARKCAADFELSLDETLEVLRVYNVRCQPQWSEKELRHKADDAVNKARLANPVEDRVRHWDMPRSHFSKPAGEPEYADAHAPDAPPEPNAEPREKAKPKPGKTSISITEVLTEWSQSGPLIHEPTGIPQLDEFTGGGPVYGTRWYLAGAPDAGKTALLVQLGHVFAMRGVAVGLLAVDEEAGDLVTRLAQRIGYSRSHCEVRDLLVLEAMDRELGALPLRFYDGTWTIEDAAADLAAFAKLRAQQDPAAHPNGPRGMLGVDSIQTVHCAADVTGQAAGRELSEVTAVTARTRAIRAMASRHRLIALATSEFVRSAYRDPAQQTATLAAGKWSGAIEYSARVLIGLRSVAGEQDLIEVEIAKNKHGPRDQKLHVRIDRRSQTLIPAVYNAPPAPTSADRDAQAKAKANADTIIVARVLLDWPGLGVREFRAKVKATKGIPHGRVDDALDELGAAVIRGEGPNNATPLSLDLGLLANDIRHAVEGSK